MMGWGRLKRMGWLALVLAASLAPAAVIKEVRISNRGEGVVDESLVRTQIRCRVGDVLERGMVAGDIKALLATGLFSYVGVEAERVEGGVALTYAVRNKLKVAKPVTITGAEALSERRVRELLGVAVGDRVDDAALGTAASRIEEEYRKEYYPRAKVKWRINVSDREAGTAEVAVEVEEGDRAPVRSIRFPGASAVSVRQLGEAVKMRAWWNPLRWVSRVRYDPDMLQMGSESIRRTYQDNGYLDVRVGESRVAESPRGGLNIEIPVAEGAQYRIGKISVSGGTIFPAEELLRQIRLKTGDVASASLIEASASAIRDYYGSRGYIHTTVTPHVKPTGGEGVVDVELAVEEGALCRIRNIEIEGNERTRDKVMRRELLVAPAEIFDEVKVRRSEKRLQNLGFFSDVRSYPRETGTPGESDLIFEVAEQKTGQFMAGAGFSSVDQLVGFVEISQGNFDLRGWPTFTGGGQKLRARAQWGSDQENYSLSFVEPWFLDRKLSLSLEGYSTQHDYEGYDVSRRGGSVGIGKALPGANRVEIKYSLEKSRIVDVTDTNAYVDPAGQPFYFTNQEDAVESSVRVTFTHDSRDNYFIPTRGMRATASGRISGGILGFDTDTYGLEGRVIQHVPLWFRHVLSLEVMAQVVDAYGDTPEVPLSDRLFIGGPMTVRGYEYRDMGPKATRTAVSTNGTTSVYTRPIGGQTLAMASAEYTIPVVTRVRLAAFFDIGNVWEEPYDVDFGNLGSSAGIGIRLDMPFFPMRFDYAWPVKKDSDLTEEEPFSFSVSYGF